MGEVYFNSSIKLRNPLIPSTDMIGIKMRICTNTISGNVTVIIPIVLLLSLFTIIDIKNIYQ